MPIRYLLSRIIHHLRSLHVLMFLNGLALAFLFFFKIQYRYENGLFSAIKARIDFRLGVRDTRDSIVIKTMGYCHQLMSGRAATFDDQTDLGPEGTLFRSTAVDLMTAQGACGSYSQVLARVISSYGYPVRIAQMKAKGIYGAHNIVEVNTGRSWVALDPTYNFYFVRPDGHLAGFSDVQKDWPWYVRQTPKGYNPAYRYEDVRYTNWAKIPILFPAAKFLLDHTIGPERANKICLRGFFLNSYAVRFYVLLFFYIPLALVTLKRIYRAAMQGADRPGRKERKPQLAGSPVREPWGGQAGAGAQEVRP